MLGGGEALWIEAQPLDDAVSALQARWPVAVIDTGLRVQAAREHAPAILRSLHDAGIDVFHLGPYEQSLEAIFLAMTSDNDV